VGFCAWTFEVLNCVCRAEKVVSKSSAAQDVGKMCVCSILVRDAAVSVPASSYMGPSKEQLHEEKEEKELNGDLLMF